MKLRNLLLLLAFVIPLVACPNDSCDNQVGPTPPPVEEPSEPTPTEPDPAPDRCDRQPNLNNTHIFTFFAAPMTYDAELGYKSRAAFESQYIVRVCRYMQEKGFNTARIGAQTDGWEDATAFYLPHGPAPYTDEWRENLIATLEMTARIPGMYVELIPTFTHKGDYNKRELVELTRHIVKIANKKGYKHIIWEAFNEFVHPVTREGGNLHSDVLEAVLLELPHPRGADFPDNHKSGDLWRGDSRTNEVGSARRLCDFIAFHPSRNPEPTREAYIATMSSAGKPVLFDETVSWISQSEKAMVNTNRGLYTRGTEEEMRRQVNSQQNALCNAGASCSFHALWLFSYDERIDWSPRCPCN